MTGARFALAFAPAPLSVSLATHRDSRTHYAKGKRSHPRGCSHSFVGTRFQVCFTPLEGVLFAFPSRYLFTIGHHLVFRLGGWAPRIRSGFHVSRPTWDPAGPACGFGYGAFTPCGRTFQIVLLPSAVPCRGPATPRGMPRGLASSAFARHYLRNLCDFFSFGY